jgi:rubrerythrin
MLDDEFREKRDEAYALAKKYRSAQRKGWVTKGSQAKANHTIEVPRTEAVKLADDLHSALYSKHTFFYENGNLRHYMEQLAEDYGDAMKCPKCFGTYSPGWMHGKCPYCEAADAAASMLKSKAVT